jgi:hypothetical protein
MFDVPTDYSLRSDRREDAMRIIKTSAHRFDEQRQSSPRRSPIFSLTIPTCQVIVRQYRFDSFGLSATSLPLPYLASMPRSQSPRLALRGMPSAKLEK